MLSDIPEQNSGDKNTQRLPLHTPLSFIHLLHSTERTAAPPKSLSIVPTPALLTFNPYSANIELMMHTKTFSLDYSFDYIKPSDIIVYFT